MLNIHDLMRGLAEKRPVFHNEADFQFALASYIREEYGQPVRLEWKPFPTGHSVTVTNDYARLGEHLAERSRKPWPATFPDLKKILGKPLPKKAKQDRKWWANCCHQPQARAWMASGWQVWKVDLAAETVLFRRTRMHVDLWLPKLGLAIELKYRTQELECFAPSLDLDPPPERFSLTDQDARDHGRYDFLRDLTRLEWVLADRSDADRGMAVLLTNDPLYWRPPHPNEPRTYDAAFRLHQPRQDEKPRYIRGTMEWDERTGGAKKGKECPIVLGHSYPLDWRDYGSVEKSENARYRACRYLAVEVPPVPAGATEGETPKNRPVGRHSS